MLSYLLAGATIGPVVSQSFLDFVITLIFVCFAVDISRNKNQYPFELRKPYFFEYGFIFYILAIIAGFLILNISEPDAWFRLYKFHWIINFYLFVWAFCHSDVDFKKWLKFFTFAYLAPNIYSIVTTFYGYDWLTHRTLENYRLVGLLESATYHAHGNGLILIFFFTILFFQFKKLSRTYQILSVLAVIIMALGIFLTFTRGIWLSLSITIAVFLFLHHRKLLITSIVTAAVVVAGLYTYSEKFKDRVEHSIQTKSADQERWDLFRVHLDLIQDSPIVGIGYTNNLSHTPATTWAKYGFPATNTDSHAHNQFLNVLATTGIVGLIPFLLFYFGFFVTNIKLVLKYKFENTSKHYILAIACLMTQLEFLIANLTDVGFEYTKIRSIILLVWALVVVMWKDKIKFSDAQ